jgi:hypothetical protein
MLNLRWNECWGDGGVQNLVFACDRITGSGVLVASIVPNFDCPQRTGDALVTWQGGTGVAFPAPSGSSCPATTPARNSTWGAVKSRYR